MSTKHDKSFTDRLLFIHHDANNMEALSHRHSVFSHIQGEYRPWKRRVRAREPKVLRWKEPTSHPPRRYTKREKQRPDGPNVHQGQSSQLSNVAVMLPSPLTSPRTLMGKGNSDPFNVFSVSIGPNENNLITLYRDYILPLMYHLYTGYKTIHELAARDWQDNISGLEEPGTALGTLARYGAIASRCNANMQPVALKYLGQSVRSLREKMSRADEMNDNFDCLHINMLFNTEIINRNLTGATAHAKMFRYILKRQWKSGTLNYKILLYELHNDLQMTSTFLVPPTFDVDEWLPMVLKPLFDMAAPHIPATPEQGFDPAIDDEYLRNWFQIRRESLYWERLQNSDPTSLPQYSIMAASFTAKTFLFHSRMMRYYIESKDKIREPGLTSKTTNQLYVHQYLALAASLEQKWSVYSPHLLGVPIYDDSLLFDTLRRTLEESETVADCSDGMKYVNAKVWALYIGALVERGTPKQPGQTTDTPQWFNRKLVGLAWRLHLFTWDELVEVLKGFLFQQDVLSHGSVWFEELVLNYGLGEEIQRYLNSLTLEASPLSR